MTSETTISIALCTYNGARFLREQLDSIFAQSISAAELVVSDDASTDGTLAIVDEAIAAHRASSGGSVTKVTVLRNSVPAGLVVNFELAIAACTGGLVVLCDQDDIWQADRLERAASEFAARPDLLLLHSDATLIDADGGQLPGSLFAALGINSRMQLEAHAGREWAILMRRNIVTGATTMFRRSLAEIALPVPAGWLHDEWLAVVAAATGTVDLTAERLIGYRQHGANQVGVRMLGLRGKVGRVFEAGSARSARLLTRATSLVARLAVLPGVAPGRIEDARAKLEHERARSRLRPSRIARGVPVLRELATGRYGRFGRGVADAARDVLQPLDAATPERSEETVDRG